MKHIQTRYGKIAYAEQGQGQPIVLIHANAGNHHNFDSITPTLAATHRVIALDLPGFGESEAHHPPAATTAMHMAAVLAEVVTALQLEPAIFIGNSVGGFAAARLAITQPERVAGLVLIDTGGFTAHNAVSRAFCRFKGSERVTRMMDTMFAKFYLKRRNAHVEAIIAQTDAYRRNPQTVAVNAALWRSFIHPEHDLRGQAKHILAPTLIVWGRHDPVLTLKDGLAAHALIPHSRLEVMDTGHMPFAEDPQGFLSVITPFIQEVESHARVVTSHP